MSTPMTLMDTLKAYGHDSLGYPSKQTLDRLYKISPDLDTHLHALLSTPIRSPKAPLYHEKQDDGLYLPILEQYVPHIQLMISSRYSKIYSVNQSKERLEALGYNVSSSGQLSNIWNKAETKLVLADKQRSAIRDSKKRVAEARKEGKACRKPVTEARKKQLADARKVKHEKDLLARLKKEEQLAKRRLANAAAKSGKKLKDIKQTKAEKLASVGNIKETPDHLEEAKRKVKETGKKVLYEPTPKQAEFHAADEDIVLYGGWSNKPPDCASLLCE